MSDVVKFGADASQYFDVVNRMQSSLDGLSTRLNRGGTRGEALGGENAFDGWLRSEFRVEHQAKFLAQQLLEARDAGGLLAGVLQAAAFSTVLPLGVGVGAIALAEGLKLIFEQSAKTKKDYQELEAELRKPLGAEIHQSVGEITSDLTTIDSKVAALVKDLNSTATKFGEGQFADIFSFAFPKLFPESETKKKEDTAVSEGLERERALTEAIGDAVLRTAGIKDQEVHQSSELAAIAKIQNDEEQKIAKSVVDAAAAKEKALANFGVKPGDEATLKGFTGTDDQKIKLLALLKEIDATQEKITAATKETSQAERDAVEKKAALQKEEVADATQVAQFRGSPVERDTLSADLALKRALAEKQIAETLGQQEGIATANLHVAQAQLAVEQARIKSAGVEIAVKASTGKTEVLKDESAHDEEAAGLAKIRLDYEQQIAKAKLAQEDPRIISNLEEQRDLSRQIFEDNFNFKHDQELTAARAQTSELELQARGEDKLASLVKTRESYEAKIAQHLHDGKGDLAVQDALQQKLALDIAARDKRTPTDLAIEALDTRSEDRRLANLQKQHDEAWAAGKNDEAANLQDEIDGIKLGQQKKAEANAKEAAARQAAQVAADAAATQAQQVAAQAQQQATGRPPPQNLEEARQQQSADDAAQRQAFADLQDPGMAKLRQQQQAAQQAAQDQADQAQQEAQAAEKAQAQKEAEDRAAAAAAAREKAQNPPPDQTAPGDKGGITALAGLDFSSLASLGGEDFSGLASLATADFSGLWALSGLVISIA